MREQKDPWSKKFGALYEYEPIFMDYLNFVVDSCYFNPCNKNFVLILDCFLSKYFINPIRNVIGFLWL